MKRTIIIVISVLVVGGALVAALLLAPSFSGNDNTADTTTTQEANDAPEPVTNDTEGPVEQQPGRYEAYSEAAVTTEGYDTTIIFFHAPWCPECRAFEAAIEDSTVPDGVQILKADYDSSTELRQKYGVTIQTTFVSVDEDGELQSKWVGYNQDKSVDAILENI